MHPSSFSMLEQHAHASQPGCSKFWCSQMIGADVSARVSAV